MNDLDNQIRRWIGNEQAVIGNGDDVDDRYFYLTVFGRADSRLARLLRLLGLCGGLVRPPGARDVNVQPPEVVQRFAGPPAQVSVRLYPFMGVTRHGDILHSTSVTEHTIKLPPGPGDLDLYVAECSALAPEQPVQPPVIVQPRHVLLTDVAGRDDVVQVGRLRIAADGTVANDAAHLPPCGTVSDCDRLHALVQRFCDDLDRWKAEIRAAWGAGVVGGASPAATAWRVHFLAHLCGIHSCLWDPSTRVDHFIINACRLIADQAANLDALGFSAPTDERIAFEKHSMQFRDATDPGRALQHLVNTLGAFRELVGASLCEKVSVSAQLSTGKAVGALNGIYLEIKAPLKAALGDELDRLSVQGLRVQLKCRPHDMKDAVALVHPTDDAARIERRRPIESGANGVCSFSYAADQNDRKYPFIRFLIRQEFLADVNTVYVFGESK